MISKFTPLSCGNKFSLTKLKKDSNKPRNLIKILTRDDYWIFKRNLYLRSIVIQFIAVIKY